MLTSRLFSEQLKGRWRLEVLLCGTTTCKELKPGHVGWRRLEVLFCTTPGMESPSKVPTWPERSTVSEVASNSEKSSVRPLKNDEYLTAITRHHHRPRPLYERERERE